MASDVRTIDDFLARSSAADSTLESYRRGLASIERWVGELHGKDRVPLLRASKRDLKAVATRLRRMKSGGQYATLGRMFFRAAHRGDLADLLQIKQRKRRLSPDEILTLPEINALVEHATSWRDRTLIVTLWETGARIHEVLAVNRGDVAPIASKENGTVYRIFFRKQKTAGEEHSGYVLEGAKIFAEWWDHNGGGPEDPLFTSFDGRRLSTRAANDRIHATAKRAKIEKRVYPHLLRHSRATHLLRIGVGEAQVRQLLGWKPGSAMIARYTHLADRDAYAALLKAHGYEVPEPEDVGRLVTELRPVVSLNPPRGRAAAMLPSPSSSVPEDLPAWAAEISRSVAAELARQPPPAWVTSATIEKLEQRIAELEAQVRKGKA